MSWEPELLEIAQRRERALQLGGAAKIARQHDGGKLTIRERITTLLDPSSFREIGEISGESTYDETGQLSEFTPANYVFGRGTLEGRPVVVGGNDYTIRGGSSHPLSSAKFAMQERMANELRIPLVRLLEGAGGSPQTLEKIGRTYIPFNVAWDVVVDNLNTVPVVSLGLGPVAGVGAARMVSSHYSVLTRGTSFMFMAGPPVVARTGEVVTKEELGGADLHARSGAVDDVAESETDAFAKAKRFLSYLPSSVFECPPRGPISDDPQRREEALLRAVPRERRKAYNMRRILAAVLDQHSFMELGAKFGSSAITGLARLDGWPVAILASDPRYYGGAWTHETNQKIVRFVDLANAFHLPVVHFVDIPGFLIGRESERCGTIRSGARALAAVYQSRVPWCSILVRKVFGVAGAGHQDHTRLHYRYAWPSADWGSLPMEGGIEAAYRATIEAAADRTQKMAEIEARLNALRSPLRTAEAFDCESIIDPRDTRRLLCEFAHLTVGLRQSAHPFVPYRP